MPRVGDGGTLCVIIKVCLVTFYACYNLHSHILAYMDSRDKTEGSPAYVRRPFQEGDKRHGTTFEKVY